MGEQKSRILMLGFKSFENVAKISPKTNHKLKLFTTRDKSGKIILFLIFYLIQFLGWLFALFQRIEIRILILRFSSHLNHCTRVWESCKVMYSVWYSWTVHLIQCICPQCSAYDTVSAVYILCMIYCSVSSVLYSKFMYSVSSAQCLIQCMQYKVHVVHCDCTVWAVYSGGIVWTMYSVRHSMSGVKCMK